MFWVSDVCVHRARATGTISARTHIRALIAAAPTQTTPPHRDGVSKANVQKKFHRMKKNHSCLIPPIRLMRVNQWSVCRFNIRLMKRGELLFTKAPSKFCIY